MKKIRHSKEKQIIYKKVAPRWSAISDVRDSIESLIDKYFDKKIDFTIITISELLENAVKYGKFDSQGNTVDLELILEPDSIAIQVSNQIKHTDANLDQLKRLINLINHVGKTELGFLYMNKLVQIMEQPFLKGSGLGLFRIAFEGGFQLRHNIKDNILIVSAKKNI